MGVDSEETAKDGFGRGHECWGELDSCSTRQLGILAEIGKGERKHAVDAGARKGDGELVIGRTYRSSGESASRRLGLTGPRS